MNRPSVPFRQFVLKVHSRCDLACDHCYVYEHADQSWRSRPAVMSDETAAWAVTRIAEHVKSHGLAQVHVVLHGGEPLLAGHGRLGRLIAELRGGLGGLCALDLRVHTNGVLLDERFLDLFEEHDVRVGVSLDGDRAANDRHRRYADGRSSYDRVIRAVERLRRRPQLYAGLLCTIDVANDPGAVYRALAALEPPRVDFLLPHATWDSPPSRPTPTAYADWLIEIFEIWSAEGRVVPVRMFESILRTSRGAPSLTESLGLEPADLVVIETDGTYEQADSLKVAYEGAPATGLEVFHHDLDAVARHTGVLARQQGLGGLCATCRACPVVDSCGGGLYAHRYRTGSGFANPSVYSADLFKLITYIRRRTAMPTHSVPAATMDALSAGFGDQEDVRCLAAAQRTMRRALLAGVNAHETPTAGWELLTRLDDEHRDAVDAVLDHPYVREWAVRCLRQGGDAGYLANIAGAAAVRAGAVAEIAITAVDGVFHLPTLGAFEAGSATTARLVAEGGRFSLEDLPGAVWHPLRRLTAEGLSVVLEDTDPHRRCHGHPVAGRLTEEEAAAWQRVFAEAWALIESDHPAYASGLRAGLTTLVPLDPPAGGGSASSAARNAFGAVAVAPPADPATLALLLVHEFQHVKLGAVLDLVDLCDPTHTGLYYAPWRRESPRPLEALLQGVYAHLAVTDFWRVRRHRSEDGPGEVQFALWREQTARAIGDLDGSGGLTPLGARFVSGIRRTLEPWLDEPVSGQAAAAAAELAERYRAESAALRR
ncbi:FxsB family cyclophane-forming radical SAM/SPASM peptide maturase [Microbispora siamensis]|uniref:FxsB family cyclophane-forming radical SAM/SPASM peptide maturase n=1 Tax=Microbispora siamensis TaxID=564413 RepID=UPI001EF368D5|nr:FxsB family cyclophane-forming radical SAM/SPASM peptide maturase [Microbispora siamensis]